MQRGWAEHISQGLAARQKAQLMRRSIATQSPTGRYVTIDGKRLLNFSSNDYLGLANHPEIVRAFCEGASTYGVGAGASHRVVGHSEAHARLEHKLAEWTGRDRALIFSSGYMANLGVLQTLLADADFVVADKLNHASLVDGLLASGQVLRRYLHGDLADLQRHLAKAHADFSNREDSTSANTEPMGIIVTDSVFSMDGDIADLPRLSATAQNNNCMLVVDDAHGIGVLGETGGGSAEYFGLSQQELPVLIGTFGKALGSAGAFVAGSETLIEWIAQNARSYIYTTAMPPALAEAVSASVDVVRADSARREHLYSLIAQFRSRKAQFTFNAAIPAQIESKTAIQPLIIGESEVALQLSERLGSEGFQVVAIRPPTVPKGTARLRVSLSSAHTPDDVDALCDAIEKQGVKLGVLV